MKVVRAVGVVRVVGAVRVVGDHTFVSSEEQIALLIGAIPL